MISSIVLAVKVADFKDKEDNDWCEHQKCHALDAGYVSRLYLHF